MELWNIGVLGLKGKACDLKLKSIQQDAREIQEGEPTRLMKMKRQNIQAQ